MKLSFGITDNLNEISTLQKIDKVFLDFLAQNDISPSYRKKRFTNKEYSGFLIKISSYLDDFLAKLFDVEQEVQILRNQAKEFDIIYECKRKFVSRIAIKKYPIGTITSVEFQRSQELLEEHLGKNFSNEIFAKKTLIWLDNSQDHEELIDVAARYSAWMVFNSDKNILFTLPEKIDPNNLIGDELINNCQKEVRLGFENNYYFDQAHSLNETNYCIYCHNQQKDYCSIGNNPAQIDKKDKNGCPLKQKISEMNYVRSRGFVLAALAIITIDNPMVAATGHRICNDCKKSCIFQKQDAVDIPLVESEILQAVLGLPWGFEIYSLLTRWNPLKLESILPANSTNYNIMVVGLGPAGFSLAHYLLHAGHNIVAIDGLKINPLNFDFTKPIKYWHEYKQNLAERIPQGFGGVAEYGITPRWDKNNLTIIRIMLERHKNFKIYDALRLTSNITALQAQKIGFDHIAIASGAGAPRFFKEGFFCKGVRTAAEFLMCLQSVGAFLKAGSVNLLIRLPVAVIGCGLTATDAAVEAINYYPLQVAKFLTLYDSLITKISIAEVRANWSDEDKIIADELMGHAKLFRTKNNPQEIRDTIINELGGVNIYYHGNLKNSTAYKLNHEEIAHSIASGIKFIENAVPIKVNQDEYGYCREIEFENFTTKARTVLIAIGTEQLPNYIYLLNEVLSQEELGVSSSSSGAHITCVSNAKLEGRQRQFLRENEYISYYGDADPKYAGSVVKAIASAKFGHGNITRSLQKSTPRFLDTYDNLIIKLNDLLVSRVKKVKVFDDNLTELTIHSPLAAQNFQQGQFFKLQNYTLDPTKIIEPLALTAVDVDKQQGLLKFIIRMVGKSSMLCTNFKTGEKIALMGPNGTAINDITRLQLNSLRCRQNEFQGEAAEHRLLREHSRNLQNSFVSILMNDTVPNESNMQCMMQGVCGQCIIRFDNEKGYEFACKFCSLDKNLVNIDEIKNRLTQNSVQEKLTTFDSWHFNNGITNYRPLTLRKN